MSAPLLRFEPLVPGELDGEWVVGKTYALRLFLFSFLPAGEHRITLVTIDREANLIESKESGALSPVWNHTIRFQSLGDRRLHYTDEIEIRAGLLTGVVWAFAHVFCHCWRRCPALRAPSADEGAGRPLSPFSVMDEVRQTKVELQRRLYAVKRCVPGARVV